MENVCKKRYSEKTQALVEQHVTHSYQACYSNILYQLLDNSMLMLHFKMITNMFMHLHRNMLKSKTNKMTKLPKIMANQVFLKCT